MENSNRQVVINNIKAVGNIALGFDDAIDTIIIDHHDEFFGTNEANYIISEAKKRLPKHIVEHIECEIKKLKLK